MAIGNEEDTGVAGEEIFEDEGRGVEELDSGAVELSR